MQEKRINLESPRNIKQRDLWDLVKSKLVRETRNGWVISSIRNAYSSIVTVVLVKKDDYYPTTGFLKSDNLLFSLQESKTDGRTNYDNGVPVLVQDLEIKINKAHGSGITEKQLEKLAEHLQKAANDFLFVEFGFDTEGCDCEGAYKCQRCQAKDLT